MSMGLLFAVLFLLFLGGFDFYHDAGFIYSYAGKPERILLCLLAVIMAFLIYASVGKLMRICNAKVRKGIVIVASLCSVALQMYFLFYVRSYYKWDSGHLIAASPLALDVGHLFFSVFQRPSVDGIAHVYLSSPCGQGSRRHLTSRKRPRVV